MLPSYYEALRPLPDDQRLQMYDAIMDFVFQGVEPKGLSPILYGYFTLLRPNIEKSVKKYSTSVENGKLGGRPAKPKGNPVETQAKPGGNQEKEKEKEKEKERESEKECDKADKPPAPTRKKYGQYGWVKLTNEEYSRLLNDLGQAEVERCIAYIDESAQSTGNKNKWRDWNLVVRRCHRDGWGLGKAAGKSNPRDRVKTAADYADGDDFLSGWDLAAADH